MRPSGKTPSPFRLILPLLLLLIPFLALVPPGEALGQTQEQRTLQEMQAQEQRWSLTLDTLAEQIRQGTISDSNAADIRDRLENILTQAQGLQTRLDERLRPLRSQLDALGPPPGEGDPAEDEETAAERQRLNDQIGMLQGLVQRSNAVIARVQGELRDLSVMRGRQRAADLLEQGTIPILPSAWGPALSQITTITDVARERTQRWWSEARPAVLGWNPYLIVFGAIAVMIVISRSLRRFLEGRYGQRPEIADPNYAEIVLAFVVTGAWRGVSPSIIVYVVWLLLKKTGVVTAEVQPLADGLLVAIVVYALVGQISRAALAPLKPQWSIVPLDAAQTTGAGLSFHALAIYLAVSAGVEEVGKAVKEPVPELSSFLVLVDVGIIVLLISPLLGNWLWRPRSKETEGSEDEEETQPARIPVALRFLRLLITLSLLVVVGAAALGYSKLSIFLIEGVIASALTIGLGLILRTLYVEVLEILIGAEGRGLLARQLDVSKDGSQSLIFWLTLLLDTILIILAIPLLLLEWGVPESVLSYWISELSSGIKFGEFTFSPLSIIYALAVFVVALVVVRFLKGLLNRRVLARTRLDVGARHSISAAFGYVGFAIAAMLAVATLGLDLSNLAIVAGALSVGIGFGLQNVVNNFVSGLLILIERPVKVGDWIKVAGYEGTVKRISVRSTEIETFDRAEVIVPNSELVSSPVLNWTHKTRIVRIIVPVGVAYGSDTELVRDLLFKCAKGHKDVLSYPAPQVLFAAFGDSSLNFELRVYARDTDYYLTLINDMHFAIDKAFRENGVEIPFPQRDLHLRGSDALAEVLKGGRSVTVTREEGDPTEKRAEDRKAPKGKGEEGAQDA
ncbi:mechanosensitive ion channel domain-containing protein [Limibacillus halophilus]